MKQQITNYIAIIWSLVILIIVIIPGNSIPKYGDWLDIFQIDKIIHLLLFAPFSFLWLLKYHFEKTINSKIILLIIIIGVLMAIITEVVQFYFIMGRNGNIADAIADIIGLILGLISYNLLRKRHVF